MCYRASFSSLDLHSEIEQNGFQGSLKSHKSQRRKEDHIRNHRCEKYEYGQPDYSAAAAAARLFRSGPPLCDPIDGSLPGSLGFSRQEHWSGLPFPSPMHESET